MGNQITLAASRIAKAWQLFRHPFWILLAVMLLQTPPLQPANGHLSRYSNIIYKRFTTDEGLSQNLISAIAQDSLGLIWIGTKDGLNMFDGYNFRAFRFDPFDSTSLADNYITSLYVDPLGRLWVGTFEGGLHLYNPHEESFLRFPHNPLNPKTISHNQVQTIMADNVGNIWVGTNGGGLNLLEMPPEHYPREAAMVTITRLGPEQGFPEKNARIHALFVDHQDLLWVGTTRSTYILNLAVPRAAFREVKYRGRHQDAESRPGRRFFTDQNGTLWAGSISGLYFLNRGQMLFDLYHADAPGFAATPFLAAMVNPSQRGEEFWFSTENGVTVLHPASGKTIDLPFANEPLPGALQGRIISMFRDMSGTIWIGSNGHGMFVFDPMSMKFNYPNDGFTTATGSWFSVRNLSIRGFYESRGPENILWIGANEGLFRVERASGSLEQVRLPLLASREESPVFALQGDAVGNIWMATGHGLLRYDPVTGTHKVFPTNLTEDDRREPRASNLHIEEKEIWVLTPNTIARFDRESNTFEHFRYNTEPLDEFKEAVFPCLHMDYQGNLWVGAKNGLHFFNVKTRQITTYSHDPTNPASIRMNHVLSIQPDPQQPQKYLWVGLAGGGFSRFDLEHKTFKNFSSTDGLANDMVYGILADQQGNLWLSSNRGLSKFNIQEESFSNFSVSDGLQSNEFNNGAYYKSPRGEMFFGGIRGYNCFFSSEIQLKNFQPHIIITNFRLLHGMEGGTLNNIPGATVARQIHLRHNQNHFTVEFASMDLFSPKNNQFAYSMSTGPENWIPLGNTQNVTFTDLKPGSYTLKIRGTNNDGIWSEQVATLKISIQTPWWQTNWALLLYLLLAIALVVYVRRYEMSRLRLVNQMKIARIQADKLQELDHLKSRFFANISHELRTPLTLIKGPLEQMREKPAEPAKKKTLDIMHSNTLRLLQLINQLLDLSKLESGDYHLHAGRGDLVALLKGLVMSFASMAEQKNISLEFRVDPSENFELIKEQCYYDPDVIEKIMGNLLANAFKFTPSGGRVVISLCFRPVENTPGILEIGIEDTGIGIPADKLLFIYDRFYQVDDSHKRQHEGTGVGLAYVKELVRVHKFSIAVKSTLGKGTKFSLRVPMGRGHLREDEIVESIRQMPETMNDLVAAGPEIPDDTAQRLGANGKPVVLVVEDHPDVSHYIREILVASYQVKQAANASDGLKAAQEFIPDLIISDVMMPGMDGFEFCERIKTADKTSHIPVILLTARARDKDRIHGLETGADDYLVKPFNASELQARVKNLVDNRRALRKKFSSRAVIKPGEISVTSRDKLFMEKVLAAVEANISNEHFNVEDLCQIVGMSHSQFHRKLKALIDQPATQFIRSVKMHRAMELLKQDAGNIAEIAYMVGFSDPGYFSKTFRAFFGKLPSEVREQSPTGEKPSATKNQTP
jgi:signal transduction histidine kinase/ligand-binding sensor domain-containing protein/DNA-binding response OmpR family regulator